MNDRLQCYIFIQHSTTPSLSHRPPAREARRIGFATNSNPRPWQHCAPQHTTSAGPSVLGGRGVVEAGALRQREAELRPQRRRARVGRQLERVEARRRHRQAVRRGVRGRQREPVLGAVEAEQLRKPAVPNGLT